MVSAIINYLKSYPEVTCTLITALGGFVSALLSRHQARKAAEERMIELQSTWENEFKKQSIQWQREDDDYDTSELKSAISSVEHFLSNPFPGTYTDALSAVSEYRVIAPDQIGDSLDLLYQALIDPDAQYATSLSAPRVREALSEVINEYRNSK